jgi:hypothetical protein
MRHLLRNSALGGLALGASLGIGVLGYHGFAHLPWIDAFLNAAMILGGEGPVDPMHSAGSKLFASLYALFSGVIFISVAGLVIAPALHRFLHRFHLETRDAAE